MTLAVNIAQGGSNNVTMRNRIINGAMVIDQRNAGVAYTNSNQSIYGLDRWRSYGLTSAVLTIQQSTTAPTGFSNSQSVTVTTSTTANDGGGLSQMIEGNNLFDFAWGTSSGVAVTASFWVRASVIGTYNLFIRFYGSTASYYYVATYTVSVANTWEQKTISISAPPVGAGAFTAALNTVYIEFRPVISSSGNTTLATANTWSTSTASKTSGCVDLASNSGATFYITGVHLEAGTTASPFEYRQYGTELILCQRYYQRTTQNGSTSTGIVSATNYGTASAFGVYNFKVPMRTAPTGTASATSAITVLANGVNYNSTNIVIQASNPDQCEVVATISGATAGQGAWYRFNGTNAWLDFSAEL
jgi:hypothetical protein